MANLCIGVHQIAESYWKALFLSRSQHLKWAFAWKYGSKQSKFVEKHRMIIWLMGSHYTDLI